jgi:hypothetical protein
MQSDPDKVSAIWKQYLEYKVTPHDSPIFTDGAGHDKLTCMRRVPEGVDIADPPNGLLGAQWWFELPPPYKFQWGLLRQLAMKVLSQVSAQTAAERHFSAVSLVEQDQRMSMTSQNQRTFVRAEIRREVARGQSNALLTVDDLVEQFGQEDGPETHNEVDDDSSSSDEDFDAPQTDNRVEEDDSSVYSVY